jgi:DNA adenine methylase
LDSDFPKEHPRMILTHVEDSSVPIPSVQVSSQPPRPFLKWAGGKGRLLEQYRPFFPTFKTYYEPFLGGGALFFYLQPSRAVLSDINPELVNVYQCIRDRVDAVITLLEHHAQQHCRDYYYKVRSQELTEPVERAARLLYLNKTCFNGLYRVNRAGKFNVPMGRYQNPKICDRNLLLAASAALQSATIIERPFDGILQDAHREEDFVYFDPPYYPISPTSDFTAYSQTAFTVIEQEKLRDVFSILAQRGVKAMLSNSDCPFIRNLYQDYTTEIITAARAINSNPDKRGKIQEVLIISHH